MCFVQYLINKEWLKIIIFQCLAHGLLSIGGPCGKDLELSFKAEKVNYSNVQARDLQQKNLYEEKQ